MTVRLVSDTACDLPEELVDELRYRARPTAHSLRDTELLDREQLGVKEFWAAAPPRLSSLRPPPLRRARSRRHSNRWPRTEPTASYA